MLKLICTLLLAASVSADVALPKYWTVHIDKPQSGRVAEFEQTGREDAAVRRELFGNSDVPHQSATHFRTSDGVYYTLRGKSTFEEIAKPQPVPPELQKQLRERTAPISDRAHATLATHHNEIWQTDASLTHVVSRSAPKYMRMRVDDVLPPKTKDYDEVMKKVAAKLQKANIATIACFSAYGDGTQIYLLSSEKPFRLKDVLPRELMREWNRCVSSSRDVEAFARPDLSSTGSEEWLP